MTESIITPQALKLALEAPGRSQAGLARYLGKDPSAINRLLKGERQIKASELPQIYRYLSETAVKSGNLSPIATSEPGAKTLLSAVSMSFSNDLRTVAATSIVKVLDNLQIALEAKIPFKSENDRRDFWRAASLSFEAIIYLGIGTGLIRHGAQERYWKLQQIAELSLLTGPDAGEKLKQSVAEFLNLFGISGPLDEETMKRDLALHVTLLALEALGEPGGTQRAIQAMKEALEKGLLNPVGDRQG